MASEQALTRDDRSEIWDAAVREGWRLVSIDDAIDRLSKGYEMIYVTYSPDDSVNVAEHLSSYTITRDRGDVLFWMIRSRLNYEDRRVS